jgi:diguanylate cyclase (GGDEF)-like protein
MSEVLKIGVIYKDYPPKVFGESFPEVLPWQCEFFSESAITGMPVAPRVDLIAVFSPEDKLADDRDFLARIFPGAELVGYIPSDVDDRYGPLRMDEGRLVVKLPLTYSLAAFLVESFSALHANRAQQTQMRGETDDLRMFFEAFVKTIESSGSVVDRVPAMNHLLGQIIGRVRAEEGLIYLCDEAGMALQRAYETSNIKDLDLFEHQVNSAVVDQVLRSGTPYLNNDCGLEIKIPFSTDCLNVHSILCLPLVIRGQKVGAIELLNKRGGIFTDADRKLMEMLVRPVAVAVSTIRHLDEAERLTITDDLTKLYNYRYLMQYLDGEVKRCLRYKKKVSLLFIDVDGFKRVNDTFGHLVGSLALAEMGQVLLKILRETDVISRYGGDEFVVVLPETPINGALVIAERIRKRVEDYEFIAQDLSIHLTVSLGVANCPKHTLTAEGLIKKADAAMYRAKELSKNNIKVAV